MKLSNLNVNQKLAGVALLLGLVALAGEPQSGEKVTLDTRELGLLVEGKVDHVMAPELADWIIQGKADYRLIDLRDAADYAQYHIPTAESATLAELPDYDLARNEKVILYSDGGIHSAQAWMLLKAKGFHGVYMILGGLESWKEEVLFPSLSDQAGAEEKARFERDAFVSKFFGGAPRSGTAVANEAPGAVMPKMEMPAVPAGRPMIKKSKKRREGC